MTGLITNRQGRALLIATSGPIRGVKPHLVIRWGRQGCLGLFVGVSVERDEDEEWEVQVGLPLLRFVLHLAEYDTAYYARGGSDG